MGINIITTSESLEQAKSLLENGADTLYIGKDEFGLRLPHSFSDEEIKEITELAHEQNKKVIVALNGLMHNNHIKKIKPFMRFLEEIKVDGVTIGDPGVLQIMKKEAIHLPFIYDAQTMVTSARQINFWKKRDAIGAVLARELTLVEYEKIKAQVSIPLEVLVYGASCIHQSKRPLLENYFNFTKQDEEIGKERGLFLSEPKKDDTQYSVYEDQNGTHVFATDDINLMSHLKTLYELDILTWKIDGLFTKGEALVSIVKVFNEAKEALERDEWSEELASRLDNKIKAIHPEKRGLSTGFFLMDPDDVK